MKTLRDITLHTFVTGCVGITLSAPIVAIADTTTLLVAAGMLWVASLALVALSVVGVFACGVVALCQE